MSSVSLGIVIVLCVVQMKIICFAFVPRVYMCRVLVLKIPADLCSFRMHVYVRSL